MADCETLEKIIKNTKSLKNKITYAEIEEEQAARTLRNDKNDSLEYVDG